MTTEVIVGGIWSMILDAGPIVQLVLIILLFFSLICWTIIFWKISRFRKISKLDEEFEQEFHSSMKITDVYPAARSDFRLSCIAQVFLHGYRELLKLREGNIAGDLNFILKTHVEILTRALKKGIEKEISELNTALSFLATTGNVAPFIGLFGTVWGIMDSFRHIGLQGSASLATVAPGISEALIATAAGLATAIPAVIAYNLFTSWVNHEESRLQVFSDEFLNRVERQLVSFSSKKSKQKGKTTLDNKQEESLET